MIKEKINTFNTRNELEAYRNELNETIDKRLKFINLCELANNASEQSFGFIKEAFENISPELFNTNKGKKIMRKYAKTIREGKSLSKIHFLYESVRKTNANSNIDFLVNKIVNEDFFIKVDTLNEEKKELGKILAEAIILVGDKAYEYMPKGNKIFDNAMEYIIENKSTFKNVTEFNEAFNVIKENVATHTDKSNIFEAKDIDLFSQNLINEFNKKYDTLLTPEEKSVIKTINENTHKEDLFNEYKTMCIAKLNEAKEQYTNNGDENASSRINEVIKKIENKQFIAENILIDICGFINMKNIFE